MKFLIAGFGSIGRRHFRNLKALGQNDIVLLRSNRSTLDTDEIKGVPIENTIEAALAHKPDGVVIANPTALHLDVAIPAAKAGVHILMEKPVSDSLERVDELKNALDESDAQLMVGFQFRFHPGLQKARALLDEGAIGRVLFARAHWGEYLPDWHPWEDYRESYAARKDLGGGVVRTLSHPIDYMRWLLGEVDSVKATTGHFSELELTGVEDMAEMQFRHTNGAISTIHVNYFQRPPKHDLEIIGTKGTIRWDNADGLCRWWTEEQDEWQTELLPADFDRNDLFLAETAHFLSLIEGKTTSTCTLHDGLRVQEIIEEVLSH
ncbi:MAG: Gfo/Idh/MocA family oxidoreductase [Anaerolineae bacterium]|jgi:predicted dehydrogenase|nr:Gfo/Idh/MocA family oxidoreductase [Anaerolineae bacterium]